MNKSVKSRFKITKTGKILRRAMAQSHFLAKRRSGSFKRRKQMRGLSDLGKKIVKKYL